MIRPLLLGLTIGAAATPAPAQSPPLLPAMTVAELARELSGETAKRNLEYLTGLHRIPGSRDFHTAILFMADRARAAGLSDIRVDSFPTDGQRFYGTQRSRPAWQADSAELWELAPESGGWRPAGDHRPGGTGADTNRRRGRRVPAQPGQERPDVCLRVRLSRRSLWR